MLGLLKQIDQTFLKIQNILFLISLILSTSYKNLKETMKNIFTKIFSLIAFGSLLLKS